MECHLDVLDLTHIRLELEACKFRGGWRCGCAAGGKQEWHGCQADEADKRIGWGTSHDLTLRVIAPRGAVDASRVNGRVTA